ncbi:uncharacterized protein METZ01_LOCUS58266, partial [marine metagenome]
VTANPVTLLLVPTKTELQHLTKRPGFALHSPCELCGFGPVSAAARTSSLIAKYRPDRVILTGIAGTFDRVTLPIGTAAVFPRVVMHGIGVGSDSEYTPAGAAGFRQWSGNGTNDTIGDQLPLATAATPTVGPLLTCCSASSSPKDANLRLKSSPDVSAEDMEGFGVALACRLASVPLAIARGISNQVGDRRMDHWQIPQALDAAWELVSDIAACPTWDATP